MPEYVFDTTALSNFAAVNRAELLEMLYRGYAFTTVEIGDELRRGIEAGYPYLTAALQQIETLSPAGWIQLLTPSSPAEHRLRSELDQVLDPGEASCLALAASRGLTLVSDDLAARRVAGDRGVLVTGTLGILVALVRNGTLPLNEANGILSAMIERRYRSPAARLDALIDPL